MEIRNRGLYVTRSDARTGERPKKTPALAVETGTVATPVADARSRAVGAVLTQVVDLLGSVSAGVEANRANRRPPVADQRLFEGASAVLTDLVEHTRVGDERPLVADAPQKTFYGVSTATTSSRAWVAEARGQVQGLRTFLDRVANKGVGASDVDILQEWTDSLSALSRAQASEPLDLTA